MAPSVSIIILTKNAGNKLDAVLAAVFANAKKFESEVIAVDSGSTDDTKGILLKYPVRLIEIHPSSFSHGGTRNLAAGSAKGDVLVFLTQDAVPRDEGWLSGLIRNFEDQEVAAAYGRQVPGEGARPVERFFLDYLYGDSRIVKGSVDPENCLLSDIFFSNVNSAIRRSDWERVKFDEDIIMSEDQEWAKKILTQGRKIVYDPSAAVIHNHRYSLPGIIGRNFDSGMSLKGLVKAPLARSVSYEAAYIEAGVLFFSKNKSYLYVPVFLLYESIRLFAFSLGFNSAFLPLSVKMALSQNKIYWERRRNRR